MPVVVAVWLWAPLLLLEESVAIGLTVEPLDKVALSGDGREGLLLEL